MTMEKGFIVPPVGQWLIWAGLLYGYSLTQFTSFAIPYRYTFSVVLGAAGIVFGGAGILSFVKKHTTISPFSLDETSVLVTNGLYRISRNPMYIGLLFVLLALGVFLNEFATPLFASGFVLTMNLFQISREESILEKKFGHTFIEYKSIVPRWLL